MLGEQTLILSNLDRSVLETKLTFRGFLICESPLKPDTALWISKFKASYFNSVIITGDNLLTAIAIGKLLKFHETKTG
jgi:P-type E1-E2 ATPase